MTEIIHLNVEFAGALINEQYLIQWSGWKRGEVIESYKNTRNKYNLMDNNIHIGLRSIDGYLCTMGAQYASLSQIDKRKARAPPPSFCCFLLFFVVFCFVFCCFLFCFLLFFVLFCFVLFCFVLFCFVLFCFVLFCFVLFCFVLFVLFCFVFVLFCFVLFYQRFNHTV